MIPLFTLLLRSQIVSKAIHFLHNLTGYHVIVHEMFVFQHNSQLHPAPRGEEVKGRVGRAFSVVPVLYDNGQ